MPSHLLFGPCSIYDIRRADWEHCGLLNTPLLSTMGNLEKKLKPGLADPRNKSQPAHKAWLPIRLDEPD